MRAVSVKKIIWIMLFLVLAGCSKKEMAVARSKDSEKAAASPAMLAQEQKTEPFERKIIREGELQFATSDIKKTRKAINESIKKVNGYISRDEEYNYDERIGRNIVIRVPENKFDNLIDAISNNVDKFETKQINSSDVTEEYIDTEIRIKIKKETELRYVNLLDKAKTVNEILSIEKQLGSIREEIESMEGKFNYMKNHCCPVKTY